MYKLNNLFYYKVQKSNIFNENQLFSEIFSNIYLILCKLFIFIDNPNSKVFEVEGELYVRLLNYGDVDKY